MHSHVPPSPPGRPSAPLRTHPAGGRAQHVNRLRETAHRTQRDFLVVNGIPFTLGITLSCFTDVPAVRVYGELTMGLVWGVLQCALFIATAWLYESRSTRSADPLEEALTADVRHTDTPDGASVDGSRW
ncbi:DUF485 domain-containing protein [Streptomyces sp. NPDC047042]|uniref:DUF485 domain-containing protein n=1 Tax=Streptomyces sp. NPDC047042 TaxID=3154807 RepID=UPI0033DA78D8